ncbi:MAG: ribonuclease P protein component [Tannerellaceae bacterium]|jgi:ribonuclease P protein component|nr:ribonuclease P protein component [Tannerellaceae bacterium]
MVNKRKYSFPKEERLSWKRHIDQVFGEGQSFVAFPLRVVYLPVESSLSAPVSMLVSVSKKRIKRAVGRNYIKRQVRETWRVRKYELADALVARNQSMFLAFLYIDKKLHPFAEMEKAMAKVVKILRDKR